MTNIELPFVEKNRSRHGTMRYYLRMDGKRICRLPDDINSEEFQKQYWAERNKHEAALLLLFMKKASPVLSSLIHFVGFASNIYRLTCSLDLTTPRDLSADRL